ncbi:MAG: COG5591: Uncharacterized conserved protein [uncultured Caballeronia sp.]|nr:MAG: COG5591: Uncharacterized conserved protein [uncultured Caballeronia sp.]
MIHFYASIYSTCYFGALLGGLCREIRAEQQSGSIFQEEKREEEAVMAQEAVAATGQVRKKQWLWLLVLPWIGVVWVPFYNKIEPVLWGFPFFYWYQLLWVLISAVIAAVVYVKTKPIHYVPRLTPGSQR